LCLETKEFQENRGIIMKLKRNDVAYYPEEDKICLVLFRIPLYVAVDTGDSNFFRLIPVRDLVKIGKL